MKYDLYWAIGYNKFRDDQYEKYDGSCEWLNKREKDVKESYLRFKKRKDISAINVSKFESWYEGYLDALKDCVKEIDEYLCK